jgi:hypothetical protein
MTFDDSSSSTIILKQDTQTPQQLTFRDLFRFATKKEVVLNFIGILFAVASGATIPINTVIFGNLIDALTFWEQQRFPGQLITKEALEGIIEIIK